MRIADKEEGAGQARTSEIALLRIMTATTEAATRVVDELSEDGPGTSRSCALAGIVRSGGERGTPVSGFTWTCAEMPCW